MSPTAINRPSAPWVLAGHQQKTNLMQRLLMCSAIGLTLILGGTSIYLRPSQPTKAGMAIITMAGIIVTTTAIAGGITVVAVGVGKATHVQSAHCE